VELTRPIDKVVRYPDMALHASWILSAKPARRVSRSLSQVQYEGLMRRSDPLESLKTVKWIGGTHRHDLSTKNILGVAL
jgi:hypothetical protein